MAHFDPFWPWRGYWPQESNLGSWEVGSGYFGPFKGDRQSFPGAGRPSARVPEGTLARAGDQLDTAGDNGRVPGQLLRQVQELEPGRPKNGSIFGTKWAILLIFRLKWVILPHK